MVMDAEGVEIPKPESDMLYVAALGDKAQLKAFELVRTVRETGLGSQFDIVGRGLKAQMKYANKIGAKYSMVLGDNEIEEGKAILKNMESGNQTEVSIDDANIFIENLLAADLADAVSFTE